MSQLVISILSTMKYKSAKNILNNKVPRIELCGTIKVISSHTLCDEFIFVLCFLLDRYYEYRYVNPWSCSFAIRSL